MSTRKGDDGHGIKANGIVADFLKFRINYFDAIIYHYSRRRLDGCHR